MNHANSKGAYVPGTRLNNSWPTRSSGSSVIESSLHSTQHTTQPRATISKNRRFIVYDGLVIDVTAQPTVVYALLIPKTAIRRIELEVALNSIIGSRSFDLPEGTVLYENTNLTKVGGVYNTLRLPYNKLIRAVFEKEQITSDPAVIRGVILPKIPKNLGLSQMQTILDKANATIGSIR